MAYWTLEVTQAITISREAMKEYLEKCNLQIGKIVDLVRGKLSTQNRITLGNCRIRVSFCILFVF